MKLVDADEIVKDNPDRRSLCSTMKNAKQVTVTEVLHSVIDDMCNNYCKVPSKYSVNEWNDIYFDCPECKNCPLFRL